MSGVNRPKALMRKVLRDRERAYGKAGGEVFGLAAWPKVWQERFRKAGFVAAYRPLPDELSVQNLFSEAETSGPSVCYPKVKGNGLDFYEAGKKEEFEKGAFSIEEPVSGLRKVLPEEIGILLIPAVAYGKDGKRIGRGKGFYDRFVSTFSGTCGTIEGKYLIGVVPGRRLLQTVPSDPWDLSVDAVLTEEEFIDLAPERGNHNSNEASK